MNATEFEIEFYAAMVNWTSSGKVGPDPRGKWEYMSLEGSEWYSNGFAHPPVFEAKGVFRWKQPKKRTVTIYGIEMVAPEVAAPAKGTGIYLENSTGDVSSNVWHDKSYDHEALANCKVFLTHEACRAMADAQRKQRLGDRHE